MRDVGSVSLKRRAWPALALLILCLPLALALLQTISPLGNFHARRIVRASLGREFQFDRIESKPFRGYSAHKGVSRDAATLSSAEIRLNRWWLLLGVVSPSSVSFVNPQLQIPKGELLGLLENLESGQHPSTLEVSNGRIQVGGSTTMLLDLEMLIEKQADQRSAVQCELTLLAGVPQSPPVAVDIEHQGVLYRGRQEYLAQSLNLLARQERRTVGTARLDRSTRLTWNPQSPFIQSLPAEVTVSLDRMRVPMTLRGDVISTGTLSSDFAAAIGGGGRLVDLAGTLNYAQTGRHPSLGMLSDFQVSADLAQRRIQSYSINARILDDQRAQGRLRLRSALVPDTQTREGTVSLENVSLPHLLQFFRLDRFLGAAGLLSLEQAWNMSPDRRSITATGEMNIGQLRPADDPNAPAYTISASTNARYQDGRLRGGWPQQRLVSLHVQKEKQPPDTLRLAADVARTDPGRINRLSFTIDRLNHLQYRRDLSRIWRMAREGKALVAGFNAVLNALPQTAFEATIEEVEGMPVRDARLYGAYSRDLLEATTATLTLADGAATASGRIALRREGLPFNLRLAFRDVNLEKLPMAPVRGTASGNASFQGMANGKTAFEERIKAESDLVIANPAFDAAPALRALGQLPGVRDLAVDWREMQARARYENRELRIEEGVLKSDAADITWQGRTDLAGVYDWLCKMAFDEQAVGATTLPRYLLMRDWRGRLLFPAAVRLKGQGDQPGSMTIEFEALDRKGEGRT